jgi:uncharacterized membrane protein YesL
MGVFLTVVLAGLAILGVLALFAIVFIFLLAVALQKDPEKFEKEFNDIYNKHYEKAYGEKPKEKAFTLKRK